MGRMVREEGAGALWTESCRSLQDLRKRGTLSSLPAEVAWPYGTCIGFDGTDDKWAYGTSLGTIKSVSLWVYAATDTEQIIDLDGGTHYIHVSGGTVTATGFTAPTVYVNGVATTALPAATWCHIVVTTGTGFSASNVQLATDNANFGQVRLAEVLLFGRVLSAAEALSLYNRSVWDYDRTLVSAWDMSDVNPPDVGWRNKGNHGTGTGLVAATDIVDGPYQGKAIETDGSTEYIDITDTSGIASMSKGTITAVVRSSTLPASVGQSDAIFALNDGGDNLSLAEFSFYTDAGGTQAIFAVYEGGGKLLVQSSIVVASRWYVLQMSVRDDGNNFFVDGVSDAAYVVGNSSSSFFFSSVNDIDSWKIGCARRNGSNQRFWDGQIAGIWLHNDGLTNLQAADLYQRIRRGAA